MNKILSTVCAAFGVFCVLLFAAYLFSDKNLTVETAEAVPLERYENPNSYAALGNIIFKTDSTGAIAKSILTLDFKHNIGDVKIRGEKAYFSDLNTKQIYCYDLHGKKIWKSAGKDGFLVHHKFFPFDISPSGELWVVNAGKGGFERLDLNTGKFLESWSPLEDFAFNGIGDPLQIVAFNGGFVTMEVASNSVRIFDMEGRARVIAVNLAPQHDFYKMRAQQGDIVYFDGEKNMRLKGVLPNKR